MGEDAGQSQGRKKKLKNESVQEKAIEEGLVHDARQGTGELQENAKGNGTNILSKGARYRIIFELPEMRLLPWEEARKSTKPFQLHQKIEERKNNIKDGRIAKLELERHEKQHEKSKMHEEKSSQKTAVRQEKMRKTMEVKRAREMEQLRAQKEKEARRDSKFIEKELQKMCSHNGQYFQISLSQVSIGIPSKTYN